MKHRIKVLSLAAVVGLCSVCANAADDPIAKRKALMKTVGDSMKASAQMVKGETEYNAATAEKAMLAINASVKQFGQHFPENSKTGGKTTAAPAIWEDTAGFKAIGVKLAETSAAAAGAAKGGKEAFGAALGKVGANCKACHEKFRIKKE